VQDEYEYLIHEVQSFPVAGITPPTSPFLPQNGDRMGIAIVNTSINNCYIAFSSAVGNAEGIFLAAGGGSFTANVRQDMTLPTHDWWAMAIAAPAALFVLEIIGWKKFPKGTMPGVP
jgi:hypothetical protein